VALIAGEARAGGFGTCAQYLDKLEVEMREFRRGKQQFSYAQIKHATETYERGMSAYEKAYRREQG